MLVIARVRVRVRGVGCVEWGCAADCTAQSWAQHMLVRDFF